MPEHIQYEDNDLFNPETHHEHSDVPVRPLFWFIVIFIAFGIASHLVLYFLYQAFVKSERKRMDAPQTQVARPADAAVPQNQPLLQPFPRADVAPQRQTPVTDMEDMRRAEKEALGTYGWVDKQHGVVRIPIDEAKKRYAAQMAVESNVGTMTPVAEPLALGAPPVGTPTLGAPASQPAGPPASQPALSTQPNPPSTRAATTTGGQP